MAAVFFSELLEFLNASWQIDVVGIRRLHSGRPPMDINDSRMSASAATSTASPAIQSFSDRCWGVKAFYITCCRNILSITGDNRHPCRTATVIRKTSPTLPVSNRALVALSYICICIYIVILYIEKLIILPQDEAIVYRTVFVIVSGSDGWKGGNAFEAS